MLLPLLAAEGATLFDVSGLLTVHAFIGMFLVPVVVLKLASTGWRMLSYYRGTQEYVLRGPPHVAVRLLVAPALVASTVVLFGTGVALLVLDQTHGTLVGLHKASFVVWAGAFGLHVLTRVPALVRGVRVRPAAVRVAVATLSVFAGVALAVLTLPAADHLQDNVTVYAGFDKG